MDEILKRLLEADILSEDSKKELEEAFNTHLAEAVETARKDTEETVRVELTEQWVKEKEILVEAIDEKINEILATEIEELKEDISRFRDLETEHAQRLAEAKAQMAEEVQSDLAQLIEKLDSFLEVRLAAEFEELREDITEARKLNLGRRMVEAFVDEYRQFFVDQDDVEGQLRESQEQSFVLAKKLEDEVAKAAVLERKIKMAEVLSSLAGQPRQVMEQILETVPTGRLEEAYTKFIGRVLKQTQVNEGKEATSEKETKVLAEGSKKVTSKLTEGSGIVKTGDYNTLKEAQDTADNEVKQSSNLVHDFVRLAGMI